MTITFDYFFYPVGLLGKSVKQGAQTSIYAALAGGGGAYYADCAARHARAPGAGEPGLFHSAV